MVDFQFMSGLNTIGGNILDIQTDLGRVIFDYGEITNSEMGELPDLSQAKENTAIFISHLHIDHVGSLRFVPKEIPIYMSEESYKLYGLLKEIGEEETILAKIYPVPYNAPIQTGDIQVTFKPSDHDIKGASALFVETPDVKLVYSGDFRLSGNNPEMVEKWADEAQTFKPDLFLIEGTTFSFEKDRVDVAEEELYVKWETLLKEQPQKMIFLNSYIRDTDRLVQFAKRAEKLNRKVVLEPKYAYLMEEMENYNETFVLKELDTKQQFQDRWITLDKLMENPEAYILQNSFDNRLFMQHFTGGIYGHSNGEPLGEYDPRYVSLIANVEENHFEWVDLNAGGHARKEDLIHIAQKVAAKLTIPWHSFYPEFLQQALAKVGLRTFLPSLGVVYSIHKGEGRVHAINDFSNE